ncbi:YciI family protein [Cellulomonas endophytica]|uniref:YciI family protein n=1 Tax=Cellulomonas endophytica TaxID=2494735 RepID=UPI0010125227|nr:YciI family protein [Cellulomonas endophytica]
MAETYMILIVEPDWDPADVGPQEWTEVMQAFEAFEAAVVAAGARILDGAALDGSKRHVRIDPATADRPAVHTDGPFAETKEFVTGYYKLEVTDAAQARQLAALCPTWGHLLLVPCLDLAGDGTDAGAGAVAEPAAVPAGGPA